MATSITPKNLRERARGAFDSVDPAAIQQAIDEACRYVSEPNWGSRFDDGVFYLACHILAEAAALEEAAESGGASATIGAVPSGPVLSERILSWSATYAGTEGGVFDDAFATTSWGRAYLARCNLVFSDRIL